MQTAFLMDEALLSISSIRKHNVKMFLTLGPHGVFISNFALSYMSTFPNHWHAKQSFLMKGGWLSISSVHKQLVKMSITLELHDIF